ncbi:MAG: hypothetical protein SFU91_00905 [Chloroherpetonaceae bacterium]|nr:hypothetical protein [Chloroherpetonaceae bacterium]
MKVIHQELVKPKKDYSLDFAIRTFSSLYGSIVKPMFGGVTVYQMRGENRMMLIYSGGTEESGSWSKGKGLIDEWRGCSFMTSQEHHRELISRFPSLKPQQTLPKWLHISDLNPQYETVVKSLFHLAANESPLIGIISNPKPKKKRKTVLN